MCVCVRCFVLVKAISCVQFNLILLNLFFSQSSVNTFRVYAFFFVELKKSCWLESQTVGVNKVNVGLHTEIG